MTNQCPFHSGNPVSAVDFLDRRQAVRRIVGRLLRGESTAIVGEPRMGKTSLLLYLAAPETRADLYGEAVRAAAFHLPGHPNPGQPVHPGPVLAAGVDAGQRAGGGFRPILPFVPPVSGVPGQRLRQLHLGECFSNGCATSNRQLVLLIDEFDLLLNHPILNSAEFYGGLRTLASRSDGALALVIASRLPLTRLNQETQAFNPTGSPYFNIFSEIVLGDFPKDDVTALLRRAGDRFTPMDTRGNPFSGRRPSISAAGRCRRRMGSLRRGH